MMDSLARFVDILQSKTTIFGVSYILETGRNCVVKDPIVCAEKIDFYLLSLFHLTFVFPIELYDNR